MKLPLTNKHKKKYAPGMSRRAESATQDNAFRTSEGGFQDGREAYYSSKFGRSVDNLMRSRRTLKPPLVVKTPKRGANTAVRTKKKKRLTKKKK